jgi:hypothetical protein
MLAIRRLFRNSFKLLKYCTIEMNRHVSLTLFTNQDSEVGPLRLEHACFQTRAGVWTQRANLWTLTDARLSDFIKIRSPF